MSKEEAYTAVPIGNDSLDLGQMISSSMISLSFARDILIYVEIMYHNDMVSVLEEDEGIILTPIVKEFGKVAKSGKGKS
eukprot:10701114-Ditylum_brightwellii.AAC.1